MKESNAMMAGVAGMLSEQDMMDIAAYYSIQTISENSANADAETLELGRKIYVGGKMDTQTTACIACHGAKGLRYSNCRLSSCNQCSACRIYCCLS